MSFVMTVLNRSECLSQWHRPCVLLHNTLAACGMVPHRTMTLQGATL